MELILKNDVPNLGFKDDIVLVKNGFGESHLYHRAHWHEDKLYYRGKVLIDNSLEVEA